MSSETFPWMAGKDQGAAMDRQALQLMLRSGRVLCFDVARMSEGVRMSTEAERQPALLFEEPILNDAIFFKEVVLDEIDDNPPEVSTRVYFPYMSEDADLGGESILAEPDQLVRAIDKTGLRRASRQLNPHDQRILEILRELPTFDPFLLLSRRGLIEAERPISPLYFDLDEREWLEIRKPVMAKIGRLVGRATVELAEATGQDAALTAERGSAAVLEAVWKGTASAGVRSLIAGFKLAPERTTELLFAWKGINYYEFQYQQAEAKFANFLAWLSDPDGAQPRNGAMLPLAVLDRLANLRAMAQAGSTRNLSSVRLILKRYNMAFDALVDQDNPALFQQFLDRAPSAFVDMGMAVGLMSHSANAWDMRTQSGRKRLGANDLEPLLDFIVMLNGGVARPGTPMRRGRV